MNILAGDFARRLCYETQVFNILIKKDATNHSSLDMNYLLYFEVFGSREWPRRGTIPRCMGISMISFRVQKSSMLHTNP